MAATTPISDGDAGDVQHLRADLAAVTGDGARLEPGVEPWWDW